MRLKRDLANLCIRAGLHLKALRGLALVPPFLLDVLLPAVLLLIWRRYGVGERLYAGILEYSLWLMPLASVWWPLFGLRDYREGDGREALCANRHGGGLADGLALFLPAVANVCLLFAVYAHLFPAMRFECARVLAVCVFYFGLTFGVSCLTRSTALTTLAVLLYTVANLCFRGRADTFLLYVSAEKITKKLFLSNYLPLFGIGLLLIALGALYTALFPRRT